MARATTQVQVFCATCTAPLMRRQVLVNKYKNFYCNRNCKTPSSSFVIPETTTEVQLAWLAGIIDGEGCIRIAKAKPNRNIVSTYYWVDMSVTMCDEQTIQHMYSLVNIGSIGKNKYYDGYSQSYYWRTTSNQTKLLLTTLYPYLVTKRREAEIALSFFTLPRSTGQRLTEDMLREREALYQAIRHEKPRNRL